MNLMKQKQFIDYFDSKIGSKPYLLSRPTSVTSMLRHKQHVQLRPEEEKIRSETQKKLAL